MTNIIGLGQGEYLPFVTRFKGHGTSLPPCFRPSFPSFCTKSVVKCQPRLMDPIVALHSVFWGEKKQG